MPKQNKKLAKQLKVKKVLTAVPKEEGICCICLGKYTGYGNNPAPVMNGKVRCCDRCNQEVVLKVRLLRISKK